MFGLLLTGNLLVLPVGVQKVAAGRGGIPTCGILSFPAVPNRGPILTVCGLWRRRTSLRFCFIHCDPAAIPCTTAANPPTLQKATDRDPFGPLHSLNNLFRGAPWERPECLQTQVAVN